MEKVIGVELSHQNAPINIREKIALNRDQAREALKKLHANYPEVFIVNTCNRLAVYSYSNDHQPAVDFFNQFGDLNPYLSIFDYEYTVAEHLFSTAAGLKSQAIGEHQILGQVRESYELARELGTLGPVLHELGKRAIRAGKRVRGETAIGQAPVSLSSVAFDLINKKYHNLSDGRIMVIGTGEMAVLLLKILGKTRPDKLYVASREIDRAEEFAEKYEAQPITYDQIKSKIPEVDVIVGVTSVNEPLLTKENILPVLNGTQKTIIDLGLPRNFAEDLNDVDDVSLYDLDRLKEMTNKGIFERRKEIPKAHRIIREEVNDFELWLKTKRLNPLISTYYKELDDLKKKEVDWAIPKLGELSPQQEKVVERMAHRIIRKMSKSPILTLKNYAREPDNNLRQIEAFQEIFNLRDVNINIPKKRILVGSRASKLALAQTNLVLNQLRKIRPEYEFVIKPITTTGDHGNVEAIGAFVKEVEVSLINGEVDMAIHSYKDLPTKLPQGLIIAGIPERGDVRDVLITKNGQKINKLEKGAVIGTSSLRRKIQIELLNPEVRVKAIHGNIITRMSKIDSGEVDGIVIAAAGLQRIDSFHKATQIFSVDEMVPAVAQGILAVEIREEDNDLKKLVSELNHWETTVAVRAERAVLLALGGGCRLPLGAYAKIMDNEIRLEGLFAPGDGSIINREIMTGPIEKAEDLGKRMADVISRL